MTDTSKFSSVTVMEDRDFWGSFSALRQLSMRRSSSSNEMRMIRERGGHGPAGSPSTTPRNVTTPLTPLTPLRWKSSTREDEEREKTQEQLSKLGTTDHHADDDGEQLLEPDVQVVMMGHEEVYREAAKLHQHMQQPSSGTLGLVAQTFKPSIEGIPLKKEQLGAEKIGGKGCSVGDESSGGHERKPSSGDSDVMTMTIEFLRARLLTERAASKSAKHEAEQLSKKVMELEHKLEEIVEQRQKAEKAAEKPISKLKIAAEEEFKELGEDATARSSNRGTSGAEAVDVWSIPQKKLEASDSLIHSRQSRAAVEDRMRKLWNQFSEEMTALAEERSNHKSHVGAEFMSWMCQMPAILQEILPTPAVQTSLAQNTQRANNNSKHRPTGETVAQGNAKMDAEDERVSGAFKLEEYEEVQESVQKEWEENYCEAQQKLEQRCRRRMGAHASSLLDCDIQERQEEVDEPSPHAGLMMRRSSEDAHKRSQQQELHKDIITTEMLNNGSNGTLYSNKMRRDSTPPPPPHDFSPVIHEASVQDSSTSRSASDVLQALQRLKLNIQGSSFPEKAPKTDIHEKKEHRFGEHQPVFPRSRHELEATPVRYVVHQATPATTDLMRERLRQSHTWHPQSMYQRPYYQHQHLEQEGANSRAPQVLESLDSPSSGTIVRISFNHNSNPYLHTLVDEDNNRFMGGSSLHHHLDSRNHVHSKPDMISLANNHHDHSNYIDKLNVGKGIQFFFS